MVRLVGAAKFRWNDSKLIGRDYPSLRLDESGLDLSTSSLQRIVFPPFCTGSAARPPPPFTLSVFLKHKIMIHVFLVHFHSGISY